MAGEARATLQRNPHNTDVRGATGAFCGDFWDCPGGRLENKFAQVREEFPAQAHIQFRVIVQGTPRSMEPSIREEVYLIGQEALSNAFRHADASSVEVELEYAGDHLRVLVRDNGTGIDARIGDPAGDACWGLWAMKERATRIGARLRILSRMAAGTEVELLLPAQIAFGKSESIGVRWFSRLYC
jgi:signal transduction histidine kinase